MDLIKSVMDLSFSVTQLVKSVTDLIKSALEVPFSAPDKLKSKTTLGTAVAGFGTVNVPQPSTLNPQLSTFNPSPSPIQRTSHAQTGTVHHMGINLRRQHTLVTEQILHGADIITILQQMRGKGMPQRVAACPFADAAQLQACLYLPLQTRLLHMMPSFLARTRITRPRPRWKHPLPAPFS